MEFLFYDKEKNKLKKIKTTNFGAKGYSNCIIHQNEERKNKYLKRHKNENWNKFWTPGSLSKYILWSEKSLYLSIINYAQKFGLKVLQNHKEIFDIEIEMKKSLNEDDFLK